MNDPGSFFVVDRIEGGKAVLVGDGGERHSVALARLPAGTEEDSVLRVARAAGGRPDWSTAALDDGERRRRIEESKRIYERLKKSDPGGDVVL
jgi:hypothetical protein